MKLPRWTTWPALAVLATFLVTAVPRRAAQPIMGSAAAARAGLAAAGPDHKRVVILGIDGMDPEILAEVIARYPERMPNFRKLISEGDGIQSLGTATPPPESRGLVKLHHRAQPRRPRDLRLHSPQPDDALGGLLDRYGESRR